MCGVESEATFRGILRDHPHIQFTVMSWEVERCNRSVSRMNGDHKTSSNEAIPLDGPGNSPVPPASTQRPRKERSLRWSNVLRVVVIFFVSALLVLPLIVFYLPEQGVSDEVGFYHTAR